MITIIFGAPGSGKSTLNAYLLKQEYRQQGRKLLQLTRKKILELNETRTTPLTVPEQPPLFADFKMTIHTGYNSYYEPYFIDGFHLGLKNDNVEVVHVPQYSKIHLSEAQRYYDSRKSNTFPEWVSRFYEMHRHNRIDITMDIQRANLVDINIRDICKHYIEIQTMEHDKDDLGRITRTKFICREFGSYQDVEDYVSKKAKNYDKTSYINEGNIFACFDSYAYAGKFVPTEGKDYVFDVAGANTVSEPTEYRHPLTKKEKEERQKRAG